MVSRCMKNLCICILSMFLVVPLVSAQLPYQQWVVHYSGIDNAGASASDLAVDADGNVYVTGSVGTMKYDANGNQMWVIGDGASKVALDQTVMSLSQDVLTVVTPAKITKSLNTILPEMSCGWHITIVLKTGMTALRVLR